MTNKKTFFLLLFHIILNPLPLTFAKGKVFENTIYCHCERRAKQSCPRHVIREARDCFVANRSSQ